MRTSRHYAFVVVLSGGGRDMLWLGFKILDNIKYLFKST